MEDILKVVGILASIFAIYKIVIDVVLARSSRRRDEYAFTKQYISDVQSDTEHLYTLEKGFYALTGKMYSIEEIKLLLFQLTPSFSISLRGVSGGFITFNVEAVKYNWKGRYANTFIQKYASNWFFAWYMVTASLALLPVYLKGISFLGQLPVAAFTLSLLVVAISCLVQQSNFNTAKLFMKNIRYPSA